MKRLATIALALLATTAARAQWVQTQGPEGGNVSAIAHVDGSTLAVLRPNHLYRLDAATDRWRRIGTLEAEGFQVVGNAVLAHSGLQLLRSTDRGTTWNRVGPSTGRLLRVETVDGAVAYGTTGEGLFRSLDNGATWSAFEGNIRSVVEGQYTPGAVTARGDTILAGEAFTPGVLRSTDGGTTWERVTTGLPEGGEAALLARVGDAFFAEIADEGQQANLGVWRSTDGGATWHELNEGLPTLRERPTYVFAFNDELSHVTATTIHGAYRLEGDRWVGNMSLAVIGSTVDAQGRLYRGTFDGVRRSDDSGQTWERFDRGMLNQHVPALLAHGGRIIAGSSAGTFSTADRGASWQAVGHDRLVELVTDGEIVLGRGAYQTHIGLVRSTDNGATWAPAAIGIEHDILSTHALAAAEGIVYAGFRVAITENTPATKIRGGLYRSEDGGATWTLLRNGLPVDGDTTLAVVAIAAHGDTALVETFNGLYRTTDRGESWTQAGAGLPTGAIRTMLAHRGAIYVGISNHVFGSTDGGASFTQIGNLLPAGVQGLFSINEALAAIVPLTDGASEIRVLANDTWLTLRRLPDSVRAETIAFSDGSIYAGTQSNSVLRIDIGTSGVDDAAGAAAVRWMPHPLRGASATLHFDLDRASAVSLELVDATGRRVAHHDAGTLGAGRHRLELPIAGLAPGAYGYHLTGGAGRTSGVVLVTE